MSTFRICSLVLVLGFNCLICFSQTRDSQNLSIKIRDLKINDKGLSVFESCKDAKQSLLVEKGELFKNHEHGFSIIIPANQHLYEFKEKEYGLTFSHKDYNPNESVIFSFTKLESSNLSLSEQFLSDYIKLVSQSEEEGYLFVRVGEEVINEQKSYWIGYKKREQEAIISGIVFYMQNNFTNSIFLVNISNLGGQSFNHGLCKYRNVVESITWIKP
ncbi:hypothetical protein [Zunongwangia profunda]|uniref:hypothetical protein n=1 Tax=Zunongwangia profunda TaxID=398743 RepID=UPI001D195F4A|nr:hypothetical protein [Zunongwangia profunda]MCC4229721.1 hypothetical protein [Zunongwangia profunda]|tara:strand:- start:642 stop:1289 length:648 start_codon:yes stop_codon:yes gene_type:complete